MKIKKAVLTGTGRRVRTAHGKKFIYDHLRERAAKLPPMKDQNGILQSHYANMKREYILRGERGVNNYLRECRHAIRRSIRKHRWQKFLSLFKKKGASK